MKTIDLKDVKTGDIIMTSSNTKLSKAIQSFQKLENKHWGMWSHSGIIWLAYGRIMVIEAQKRGICITPIEHYLKPEFSLMILKPHLHIDGSEMAQQMLPYCGNTDYDFFNLLFSQPIKILFKKWIGAKKQKARKFICHEWTAFSYNRYFEPRYGIIFANELQVNAIDLCKSKFFDKFLLNK